jgi:dTDP-4-amino-4,6-dideoxygalactose transaminase
MTAETLARVLTDDVSVVLLTHQFGVPAEIDSILQVCRERGLFVIEDAAPALGARYQGCTTGSFGDATVVSFGLTKVINAGRGGALLTNDERLAGTLGSFLGSGSALGGSVRDFAQAMGWWGVTRPWIYGPLRRARGWVREDTLHEIVVPNKKLPANAFGCCSGYLARLASRGMESLESNIARRQVLARIYTDELAGLDKIRQPVVPAGAEPAWIQYPIFVERKKDCYKHLVNRGVDLNWTFRYSCGASYGVRNAPNSERAARTVLGLPTYPGLEPAKARRICALLRLFVRS